MELALILLCVLAVVTFMGHGIWKRRGQTEAIDIYLAFG